MVSSSCSTPHGRASTGRTHLGHLTVHCFQACLAVQSGSSLKVHFFAPSGELMVLNFDACLQRLFVQPLPNPSALRCPEQQRADRHHRDGRTRLDSRERGPSATKGSSRLGPIQRQPYRNIQILQQSTPWMRPSVPCKQVTLSTHWWGACRWHPCGHCQFTQNLSRDTRWPE